MTDRMTALGRLAEVVASSSVEDPLSLRMCRACQSILGTDGGTITLAYDDPGRVTLCATDERAARLEEVQEVIGQGPSYDAYEQRTLVVARIDGVADERWPLFSEAAKNTIGECVIYAVPIMPGPETMGVATFYQVNRSALLLDLHTCQFLLNAVGVALVNDPDVLDDDRFAKAESWSSRARIHQATGMVMAQLGLSAADALALIRAHAYAHEATLDEISVEIVAWRIDFTVVDHEPGGE